MSQIDSLPILVCVAVVGLGNIPLLQSGLCSHLHNRQSSACLNVLDAVDILCMRKSNPNKGSCCFVSLVFLGNNAPFSFDHSVFRMHGYNTQSKVIGYALGALDSAHNHTNRICMSCGWGLVVVWS